MKYEDYPKLFISADTESVKAQSTHLRFFKSHVALLLLGAILAIYPSPNWALLVLNAFVFLSALAISLRVGSRRYERSWYSTRAAAESVKTATWRYMMRAEPFLHQNEHGDNNFCGLLKKVFESNPTACALLKDKISYNGQITEVMRRTRAQSLQERLSIYSEFRLEEQLRWYNAKVEFNRRKELQFHYLLVVVQCVAVGLVLVRIAFAEWSIWPTEVFVVAAGAIGAWVQLKRYQEHGAAYALAAQEITVILGMVDDVDSQERFSAFVRDAENAFSREHTQWVVKAEN